MTNQREFYESEAKRTRRYDSQSFWDSRYHKKRKKRILSLLKSMPYANLFVDVGCGTGEYVIESSLCTDAIGIDVSKNYLANIKKLHEEVHVIQADACALPLKNKCAEYVLCSETIEHLPNPLEAIAEIARVVERTAIFSTPNYGALRILLSKISPKRLKNLDESVGHIQVFSLGKLLKLIKKKCKVTSEEVIHVMPPIIGESFLMPRRLERIIDIMEMSMEKFFPKLGNISIIVCEPTS